MRVLIQRVKEAKVDVQGKTVGSIDRGILVFFAVHQKDKIEDISWLSQKVIHLRIFPDEKGKMNLSLYSLGLSILVISQFTLYGDCIQGRRPFFGEAASPERAEKFYQLFLKELRKEVKNVQEGVFAAKMQVALINDGPVTLLIDTKKVGK
jgi:D-tyrosyl-tRNA(Tyr) deacylase